MPQRPKPEFENWQPYKRKVRNPPCIGVLPLVLQPVAVKDQQLALGAGQSA